MIETGDLQIGDVTKAIFHLGNVYEDPRDALAEFVTNGIDARGRHILVRLHRRGSLGSIEIEDDGDGMNLTDLRRIALRGSNIMTLRRRGAMVVPRQGRREHPG